VAAVEGTSGPDNVAADADADGCAIDVDMDGILVGVAASGLAVQATTAAPETVPKANANAPKSLLRIIWLPPGSSQQLHSHTSHGPQ
jgi:hypothetical protein